jgi:hypothetical protein
MPPGPLVGLCLSGHQQTAMARLVSWIGVIDPGSTLFRESGSGELAGTAAADCAARDGVAVGSGCGLRVSRPRHLQEGVRDRRRLRGPAI